jgi:hypothetical protein
MSPLINPGEKKMSEAKHGGGLAFPRPAADYIEDNGDLQRKRYHGPQDGMSLRDYFAAKAMAAHISRIDLDAEIATETTFDDMIARWAYEQADAMLKVRGAA